MAAFEKDGFYYYGDPEACELMLQECGEALLEAKAEVLAQRIFQALQSNRIRNTDPTPEELLESLRKSARVWVRAPKGQKQQAVVEHWLRRYYERKAQEPT